MYTTIDIGFKINSVELKNKCVEVYNNRRVVFWFLILFKD